MTLRASTIAPPLVVNELHASRDSILSNTRVAKTGFWSQRNSAEAPESAIIGARVCANPPKARNNKGRMISRIVNFSAEDTALDII
jgi:hypothetical protein